MDGQKRILLVSRNLMVLQTRKLMLGAYFEVSAAGRVVEATKLLAERSFALIVLCYTLTGDDCEKILDAVRRTLATPRSSCLRSWVMLQAIARWIPASCRTTTVLLS